jgi:hypothetical protein
MTNQAKKDFDKIVDDLSNTTTGLLKDIHAAISDVFPIPIHWKSPEKAAANLVYPPLITFYFGVQKLIDDLPSPPINVDSVVAAALSVTTFFDRNAQLFSDLSTEALNLPPGPAAAVQKVVSDCSYANPLSPVMTTVFAVLEDAYKHPASSSEMTFQQLQGVVDALAMTQPLNDHDEKHKVIKDLDDAKKSLKALQDADFQPTQGQVRAYTRAWFDVTKHLDAKSEKKGKHREHIASLIEIRDGLSAVTSRLGVLAEVSVGIDIPEF